MTRPIGNNIGHPIINGVVTQELKDAIARVLSTAQRAGKKTGVYCTGGEQAKLFADQGFDMMNVVTDYTALGAVAREQLNLANGGGD